jgi:hypothetical protein
MPNDSEAEKAIQALNGSDVGGRSILVNRSEDKKSLGSGKVNIPQATFSKGDEYQGSVHSNRTYRSPDKKKGEQNRNFSKSRNNKNGRRFE